MKDEGILLNCFEDPIQDNQSFKFSLTSHQQQTNFAETLLPLYNINLYFKLYFESYKIVIT